MFDKIIQFSIYNKLIVGIGVAILMAWGAYSVATLSIDAVPDITNNQVQVITVAPTLAAQEVEQYVTSPIEFACLNLPDMVEFRSISRLGLSVITIVFEDDVDIYLARQMINERLKQAEGNIPKGVGTPELGPVSTGLGEIYQYVINNKKGQEATHSAMELRTIQDWIVRKQLLSVPGVAEINTLGGYLKQYEIAINTDKLKALDITVPDVFSALERNNENTGGSYIEKNASYFFIRGIGMTKSLEDIASIAVKTVNEVPILISDIAKVQYGSAIRYGAATRNGEGEVVVGVVMMLKGENSADVTKNVKAKIKEIEKSLPEGVVIEPFLDRSKLVDRAIGTVTTNLMEGALIVIFILVLLLGNLRAGLVVASVIPLAMLFAICMMKLFGVSGNLMSLGAIDFGLIVDGAIIIVESIVYRIRMKQRDGVLSQDQMNSEVYAASSKIRKSAAFGELIILIVYLPILTLSGIEGKMFTPMAQTVGFAIFGAFILSLTYVPMMSALCLNKKASTRKNISDYIINFAQRIYMPIIKFSVRIKYSVVAFSILLFIGSLFVFNQLGGEFIPTLEEGDLAINTRVMPGSSLTQNILVISKVEAKLKKNFPEIIEVVSRIGSSEIPTDPMSVEVGDIIVTLKDKSEWTRARNREELSDMIKSEISTIPGISIEISQPIQLRFNELMTGVRSDVAMKIYGEDLDILAKKSTEIIKLIESVEGIADLRAEQITGLPQISVKYNRSKIAQFGLDITTVNQVLRTSFAGEKAGVIFEGDRRFDMVVRLEKDKRSDIEDINSLWIPLPNGGQVPLEELASIKFEEGPMQISRDNGNRRMTLGLNVRNRDVLSVVQDIQEILEQKLELPPGYYITYGGQFENLIEANKRLGITVPIALLLIVILLFFTFHSFKQTLLILTAVPLSAIGGIFSLWYRDMPFSISAGVGFIALFGVAVLNGIVLIAEFNRLKEDGVSDIYERVFQGTKLRLRPVIMTAAVASLGFLPMALSNGAGAEVQKPLATVVIGGLITATVLTLIVLPVLYILFSNTKKKGMRNLVSNGKGAIVTVLFLLISICSVSTVSAQNTLPISVEEAVEIALKNNPNIINDSLRINQQIALKKTAFNIPKTDINYITGQLNDEKIGTDKRIVISQKFHFPTVYTSQHKTQKQYVVLQEKRLAISKAELIRDVKSTYYNLVYSKELQNLYIHQDSIYKDFAIKADLKQKTGESSYLESLTAKTKHQEIKMMAKQIASDIKIHKSEMQKLLHTTDVIFIKDKTLNKLEFLVKNDGTLSNNPSLAWYQQKTTVANSEVKQEKNKYLPDLSVGYLNQSLDNVSGFSGVQFGVSIPIFSWGQKGKVQAAKIQSSIAENNYEDAKVHLQLTFNQEKQEFLKNEELLNFQENYSLKQATEILKISQFSYNQGEIGYVEHIQNLSFAINIKIKYLQNLNQFNQKVINLNYLSGTL